MAVITQEVADTMLIPVDELPPGALTAHRNKIKSMLTAIVSKDLALPPNQLIVRDIRWVEDMQAYSTGTTAATINDWIFTTAASATTGFVTITGDQRMAQNRYVALYGVRDLRFTYGTVAASVTTNPWLVIPQCVSQIKIDVGGGTRAIWDLSKVQAAGASASSCGNASGIAMSAVIIPQLATYNISFYKMIGVNSTIAKVVFEGFCLEPRGVLCSP